MARGSKGYDKTVRTVNKGQAAPKKKKTVHKMVESPTEAMLKALIAGDSAAAQEALAARIQGMARKMVMGEGVIELEIDGEEDYSDEEGMGDEEGEMDMEPEGDYSDDEDEFGDDEDLGDDDDMEGYDEYSDDEEREYDPEVDGSPDESMDDMGDEDEDFREEI